MLEYELMRDSKQVSRLQGERVDRGSPECAGLGCVRFRGRGWTEVRPSVHRLTRHAAEASTGQRPHYLSKHKCCLAVRGSDIATEVVLS